MEYTYAIVLSGEQQAAQTLMQIKKLTGLSLSEAKDRIAAGLPLLQCDCDDEDGMVLLLELHDTLEAQGVESTFLDCGDPAPIQYLRNALEAYRENAAQMYD